MTTACLALLLVPQVASATPTWKLLRNFGKSIGCGYFFDKDHGLIGSGVRPGSYFDTIGFRVVPGNLISIYKTTDGGTSWTTSKVPAILPGAVTSISMIDSLVGYASIFTTIEWDFHLTFGRSAIWKTVDGGDTWTNDLQLENLATCVYAQHDLLMFTKWDLYEVDVYRNGLRAYLPALDTFGGMYSYDNGQTWTKNFVRGNGIAFSDSLHGVVSEMNTGYWNFWVTSDAGRSWSKTSGQYEAWSLYAVPNTGMFFCANEAQPSLSHSTINWSSDYGNTWGPLTTIPRIRLTGGIAGKGSTIYIQTDTNQWYNFGFEPPPALPGMYRSDDLGRTWKWVEGPSNSRDSRFVVTGCSGEVVYAFDAYGGVWKTEDGGDGTLLGGNPNDADLAVDEDSLSLTLDACGDSLTISARNPGCVWVVVDSISQVTGTDLVVPRSIRSSTLHEGDSATFHVAYQPTGDTTTTSLLRVYAHAGGRTITRDIPTTLISTSRQGIILSRTSSTLQAIGCETVADTLYLASISCPGLVVDSATIDKGEVTLRATFPDTVGSTHMLALPLQFTPDSAGVHDLQIHLHAHLGRRVYDTILYVHAESIRTPEYFILDSTSLHLTTSYCEPAVGRLSIATSSCDSVVIDSVVSASGAFSTAGNPLHIPSHAVDSMAVLFAPDSLGNALGSLHLYAHSRFRSFDTIVSLSGANRGLPQVLTLDRTALTLQTTACAPTGGSFTISNQACDDLVIDTVYCEGSEMSVTYDASRFPMRSDDSLQFVVTFSPDSGNTRTVPVHLVMHTKLRTIDTVVLVTATNVIPTEPAALSTDTLLLETRYCQPITLPYSVLNVGCPTMLIDSVRIEGDRRHEFTAIAFPHTILSQSAQSSSVTFLPDSSGTRTVALRIFGTSAGVPIDTILWVTGHNITSPDPYLEPLDSMIAGGEVLIPIKIRRTTDPFALSSLHFSLGLNTNILTPTGLNFGGTCSNVASSSIALKDGRLTADIQFATPLTDTANLELPIAYVVAKVFLSTTVITPIVLDSFTTDREPTLALCSEPLTYFNVALLCSNPELIEVMRTGTLALTIIGVSPNPATHSRTWSLRYRLGAQTDAISTEIYDMHGVRIYATVPHSAAAGEHSEAIPVPGTSGDYLMVIRTPEGIETVRKLTVAE